MSDAPKSSGSEVQVDMSVAKSIGGITRTGPLAVAVLGISLIFIVIGFPLTRELEPALRLLIVTIGATLTLAGVAIELMTYLQSTRYSLSSSNSHFNSIIQKATANNLSQLKKLQDDIEDLKKQKSEAVVSKAEKEELVLKINNSLTSDITDRIAYSWENKFRKVSEQTNYIKTIQEVSSEARLRLRQEVEALGKRANVNLTIGVLISLTGICILSYFIYLTTSELTSGLNTTDVFIRFVIRFSLAAFVQLFAYFFLRLYRYSIFETKYFQNEITNLEEKFIALQTAIYAGEKPLISAIAKELSKTERNFILKKGEMTVSLRREQMEIEFETDALTRLERIAAIRVAKNSSKE